MTTRIHNVQVVTPDAVKKLDILVSDGLITGLVEPDALVHEESSRIDGKGAYAFPGMVDVLTHGFGHYLYTDADPESIAANSAAMPRVGVTSFLPSVLSLTEAELLSILKRLAGSIGGDGARVLGLHSEGPCLASAGAHKKEWLLKPTAELAKRMVDAANGQLAIVTLAPELPDADAFCAVMRDAGVAMHIGHSCGTADQVQQFVDMGISAVTHMYDVMVPASVTEPGAYPLSLADALLAEERLALGLICDGVHVHPTQVKLLTMLAPGRLFLETDSMKFTGLEPGRFEIYEGAWVNTSHDNAARMDDGGLSGSCITSDRALRKLIEYSGVDLPTASIATSLVPARLAGRDHDLGSLEVGKCADLIILDPDSLEVQATYVGGTKVYG